MVRAVVSYEDVTGAQRDPAREFAAAMIESDGGRIEVVDYHRLLGLEIEKRQPLLAPWLLPKSLCMVHAWRGTGKTWFALEVAYAIASGGDFLGWKAQGVAEVLYLDGEMPADVIQERLRTIGERAGATPPAGLLRLACADLQDMPMPNLATPEGQIRIDDLVTDTTSLIVVDNVSCLVRHGEENDAASWLTVSEWALRHRRAGRAVLFIHHSGKTGKQRGTSKREDLLDVVISLRRPADYSESDGAVFEVHFEKARTMHGDSVEPIEARLVEQFGGLVWNTRQVVSANAERIVQLWDLGMGVTEIAAEVELNKSNVTRNLQKAAEQSKLKRAYPPVRNNQRNPNQ